MALPHICQVSHHLVTSAGVVFDLGLRVILGGTLCGDGGDGYLRFCGVLVGDLGEAAFGEDV
jgi:hypothetical protein